MRTARPGGSRTTPTSCPSPCGLGEIVEYAIALSPTANRFRAGHRLRLRITALDLRGNPRPAPGVSPVHYPWHVCSSRATSHTVHHDHEHPSSLLVPVIPK